MFTSFRKLLQGPKESRREHRRSGKNSAHSKAKPFHAGTPKSCTRVVLILVSLPNARLKQPQPAAVKERAQNRREPTSGSLNNVYTVAINQVITLSAELFIGYLALFNDLFTLWLIYKLLLAHQGITKIACLRSSLSKGQGNLRNLAVLNQSSCTSFSNRDDRSVICRPRAPPRHFLFLSPVPFAIRRSTGPGVNSTMEHCFQCKINKNLFLPSGDTWISLFFHVRSEAERSRSSSEMSWMFYRNWQASSPTRSAPESGAIRCPPSFLASTKSPAVTQGQIDLSTACWAMNCSGKIKGIISLPEQNLLPTLDNSGRGRRRKNELPTNGTPAV